MTVFYFKEMVFIDINFYYVKNDYIDFLKKYELENRGFTCVPNTVYSSREKFLFGTVFEMNGINFFVPISSKTKGRDNDILISLPKKNQKLGSLRFQYMIPVPNKCLVMLQINEVPEEGQRQRIRNELKFCRRNIHKITLQAQKTYEAVCESKNDKLLHNSCDFKLLEKAYIIYCYENGLNLPDELKEQYPEITKNDTEQSNIEPSDLQPQKQPDSEKSTQKNDNKKFTITRKKFNENVQKVSRESSEQSAALQTKSRKRSTGNPNGSSNPDNR